MATQYRLQLFAIVLGCLLSIMPVRPAATQPVYPTKQIDVLIGYGPGGIVDVSERFLAGKAEKILGQPMVITNNGGGGSSVAVAIVATKPPDGYFIAGCASTGLVRIPQFRTVPYKWDDLTPIMHFATPILTSLVVRSDSPFKSVKDLVEYARANPGKIKYATASPRGTLGFNMILIAQKEKIEWEVVPFSGGQLVVNALLGGHVQVIMQGAEWMPQVQAGTLRLLAVAGEKRNRRFPDVPCLGELGYQTTIGPLMILGPAGMPKDVVKLLDATFKASLEDPATVKIMDQFAVENVYMDHEQTTKWAMEQVDFFKKFIKEIGIGKP